MKQKRSWTLRPIAWLAAWSITAASVSVLTGAVELISWILTTQDLTAAEKYAPWALLTVYPIATVVCLYVAIVIPSLAVQGSDFIYPSTYSIRYILITLILGAFIVIAIAECDPTSSWQLLVAICSSLMVAVYGITMTVYGWTAAAQRRKG